jgi:hypothetical protein
VIRALRYHAAKQTMRIWFGLLMAEAYLAECRGDKLAAANHENDAQRVLRDLDILEINHAYHR